MQNKSDFKILAIDDDKDILLLLKYNLESEGYYVETASSGKKGISIAQKINPNLMLVDIMMPEMDGIEACEKIRSTKELSHILITFFTARGEDYSQVAGFDVGADDYITKPIKPKVLVSKIKALLRRITNNSPKTTKVNAGGIIIDREEYVIIQNGKKLSLPRKEFELFALLASKPDKVFKRDDILNKVWGNEVIVGGRTIDVHIRKLREKIGDEYFKTVKGVGYKFVINEN